MKIQLTNVILKKIPFALLIFLFGGFFCRYLQLKNELLYDGSLAQGAIMHRVLLLLTVLFFIGFGVLVYGLKKLKTHKACFFPGVLPALPQFLAGFGIIAGSVLKLQEEPYMFAPLTKVSATLVNALPYLGIVAAICILCFALWNMRSKTPSPILYMLVSVYLVVRLIVCFQEWNTDPSIHDYAYELLAAICCMLGCFQISGFGFNKGKRRITTFWCMCAVFFCSISAADVLKNLPELLINLSLLLLTLTHGLQLLFAKEDAEEEKEEAPSEEPSPEPFDE